VRENATFQQKFEVIKIAREANGAFSKEGELSCLMRMQVSTRVWCPDPMDKCGCKLPGGKNQKMAAQVALQ
jgi:hypothetical protein